MSMRGIRGATTVEKDTPEEIEAAVLELGQILLKKNKINPTDIGAIIFSATDDLTSAFPAAGMRKLPGMEVVPLFDARQMAVVGSLQRCIRVLMLTETELGQKEIAHVYLRRAAVLRPDLAHGAIDNE